MSPRFSSLYSMPRSPFSVAVEKAHPCVRVTAVSCNYGSYRALGSPGFGSIDDVHYRVTIRQLQCGETRDTEPQMLQHFVV